jgi:hypothetical protein
VLFPERISIEELTSTKELFRQELRGWRIRPTSPPSLILQPKDDSARKTKIALTFPIDDQFERWLESLPCLDDEEKADSEAEISQDSRLGEYAAERTAALARGRTLAKRLSNVSLVVCLWAIFYPTPYKLLIGALVVLPWVGIEVLRRSNGLFRVDEVKNDVHPSVASALLFPTGALALRAVLDYNVRQSAMAFVLYAGVGGVLILLAARFDPSLWTKRFSFAVFCALGFAYGFGVVTEINAQFDRSVGTSYSTIVHDKHIVSGKHTSYVLKLDPWGPETKPNNLDVGRATYNSIQCGDVAQITLRKGALGLNWYYLQSWRQGETLGPCK